VARPLRYRQEAARQANFNDLLSAIGKKPRPAPSDGTVLQAPAAQGSLTDNKGDCNMKKIVTLAALAVFALGAVVGRASVSVTPRVTAEVFSPASVVPVNPNLPIEHYTAI
jgi:hypothetical protein